MELIPFDQRDGSIWINGHFRDWKEVKIHVLNHGLHYGSCVFEGIRVYNKKIFKLYEHVSRLFYSAKKLDLNLDFSENQICECISNTVKRQSINNGYIRPVIWRGSEKMAISAVDSSINIAIAAWSWPSYFSPKKILEGISMSTSKWRRPPPECAPTDSKAAGLYMICSLSKHEAEKNGFDDALMLDYRGYIAEATGANIFFVKDDSLFTPKADCFLNGITRQVVIEIARNLKININEQFIKPDFIENCQEAFLTGTAVEITPIKSIDDFSFSEREITIKLMDEFKKIVC